VNSNGAIGCDLEKDGLGFCMLLKSDGTGLYATKDIALALRKFNDFGVQKSLYVVDAAQTHHFKQVFKTLEKMGYEQAKDCVHLAYGQVVLSSGKMSSRKGNVVYFSKLQQILSETIYEDFLKPYEGQWSKEEIQEAIHTIAVATIRYGMLNHDISKDIVFELKEWLSTKGNTGPYMLYAYARIRSILRKFPVPEGTPVDFGLLTEPYERDMMFLLSRFWPVVLLAKERGSPITLCDYLFEVGKAFSLFYQNISVAKTEDESLKATRMAFIQCVAEILKAGLSLLGIKVLERM